MKWYDPLLIAGCILFGIAFVVVIVILMLP